MNSSKFGKCIERFLVSKGNSRIQAFSELIKSVDEMVARIVISTGLKKVVTEKQQNETALHLIKEIITEPCDFKTLNQTQNPPLSNRFSEFIREKVLLQPENYHAIIQAYTFSRIRTLLREYADQRGKNYILFNNRTKNNLKSLQKKGLAFEARKNYWSANENPIEFCRTIKSVLPLQVPVNYPEFNLKKNHYADSIKNFLHLPNHKNRAFARKLITEFFFNNFVPEARNSFENHEAVNQNFSFIIKAEAEEALKLFLEENQVNNTETQQIFMAGLAHLCHSCPKYLKKNPLNKKQLEKPVVDCVEDFLNDRRFNRLNNWKPPKRSTANNRLKSFQIRVQCKIQDLPHESRLIFIKGLTKQLFRIFVALSKGGLNE